MKRNDDSPIWRILVRRAQVEQAGEDFTQPAPQIVHGAVGQRHVGHAAGPARDLVGRPEAAIDVDRLVPIGQPRDAHRPVLLHAFDSARPRLHARAATLLLGALLLVGGPAAAGEATATTMPAGYAAYHTYAEMVAKLDAAAAAHPQIVHKFSIGRSHEGRQIWAVKISDNVNVDEDEPEVVFDSLLHARERLTVEMNLYLLDLLTDRYGKGSRVTSIVNSREIFIIPMLNPDGGEYDIASGDFKRWRKNRQPIPGSSSIGVDLNRNFGFKWGCCGGSSGNPSAIDYRGPESWFAPEVRAYRDFIDSRVVGGRQQIRAAVTWHTAGEFVLWPYAYTTKAVPKTMSADDRDALAALGRQIAARNGYRPAQSGDWYISDGDQIDWLYGRHRIFAYTIEMYPRSGGSLRWYPDPALIGRETSRNRDAMLHLLEQAACPYRAAGLAQTHCGPLNDDFETARGWTPDPFGTDSATDGGWQRGEPERTQTSAGVKQSAAVPSGRAALVTGLAAGKSANSTDVDGGTASIRSVPLALGAGSWTLSFRYSFAHDARATDDDLLRVRVQNGGLTTVFVVRGNSAQRNAKWLSTKVSLDAFAGQTVRLLIEATDAGPDALVEAAIDDVRVYRTP